MVTFGTSSKGGGHDLVVSLTEETVCWWLSDGDDWLCGCKRSLATAVWTADRFVPETLTSLSLENPLELRFSELE